MAFCYWRYVLRHISLETDQNWFYKFGWNRNGAESNNVVSAENETEAEFNTLFRPKPKPKINNTECITYVYNPKCIGYFNVPSML